MPGIQLEANKPRKKKSCQAIILYHARGVDNFLGLGGGGGRGEGANKVKTKELQFGSRGRVQEGNIAPSCTKCKARIFFKIQEV